MWSFFLSPSKHTAFTTNSYGETVLMSRKFGLLAMPHFSKSNYKLNYCSTFRMNLSQKHENKFFSLSRAVQSAKIPLKRTNLLGFFTTEMLFAYSWRMKRKSHRILSLDVHVVFFNCVANLCVARVQFFL